MSIFKCKMCGGTLEITANQSVAVCEYCGTQQTLPKLDDDRRANLYDRANHFRRNNDFDKAAAIYESILNEDGTDAEAYWSLVLCHYGIEYVEDPATRKRIPTVNRAQFTSVFDDDNYKSALQYADGYQKNIYEAEAAAINEIQKGILAISQREEPFDVFICYKETDNTGRRTPDSVLANDLYHQLTAEGYKVFFSRITLEDKLGTAYEPYIFAALNSAKVMVVLGTKPEYFNAVWVKNEWSRFLALVKKSGGKKVLIPAYRDMDPYDLPEEFSHLQAQDMSKLGFMQDLIRGIKKLTARIKPNIAIKEVVGSSANISALLQRGNLALEDSEWIHANEFFDRVLDMDAQCAEAYLGKLMAEIHCKSRNELRNARKTFEENSNYRKVLRFADEKLKEELKDITVCVKTQSEDDNRDLTKKRGPTHTSGKNLQKIIAIICVAIALAVAGIFVLVQMGTPNGDGDAKNDDVTLAETQSPTDSSMEGISYPEGMLNVLDAYPDAYAWLTIPNTAAVLGTENDVNYPVAQHPTDSFFYIDHDLDGNKYQPGTLFTQAEVEGQYANGKDLNDPVTVIYGHNQYNNTMFGGLQEFAPQLDFTKANYMYMYQEGRRIAYRIVGGVQFDTSHILYYNDFANESAFNKFFAELWQETDTSTNVDFANCPTHGDRVLILSVPKDGDDNHRYLVIGVAEEELKL